MKKWTVRRSALGNWIVRDPKGACCGICPAGMWSNAFYLAFRESVEANLGIVGVEVTS